LRYVRGNPLLLPSPPYSLAQVWLAFGHRIGAIIVSLFLLMLAYKVFRMNRPSLLWPGIVMVGLLVTQITLGILTVLLRKPADIASAHVAVGALVLVTTFVLAAGAVRLYRPRRQAESHTDLEQFSSW
jgi:cytochrome c oxidase assembly protein subunit 15